MCSQKLIASNFLLCISAIISRLTIAAAIIIFPGFLFAQTLVTVGAPSSTSSTSGLANSTTAGDRNERHMCIYSAAELTSAGIGSGTNLLAIAWEKTGAAHYYSPNLTIRVWLKHSASTTFAASPVFATETASATLVYETTTGSIPMSAGWIIFPFNTATPFFTWDGVQHLEVITELIRPTDWTETVFNWRTITSVTNGAANSSGTIASPPVTLTRTGTRPQIRLGIPTTGDDAALTGMPSPVNATAGSQNINVILRNTGSNTLTSASIAWTIDGGAPTNFPWSGSLVPGAMATLTVGSNVFTGGPHVVNASVSNPNGMPDQDPANNTFTKNILICNPLAGAYTINQAQPTGGTNFNSLTDFSSYLSSCGVGGHVTATVVPGSGPYVEQVVFQNIPGLSITASVTLNGNGETVTSSGPIIQTGSNPERHIIRLIDLRYFTVNNFHIQMVAGSTGFIGVHVLNSGDHITISNCTVDMGTATSSLLAGFVANGDPAGNLTPGGNFDVIQISGNTVNGGGYGASVNGLASPLATNLVIENNHFNDFSSNAVYLRETNGAEVRNNHFDKSAGSTASVNAIQLAQLANINGRVHDNFIKMTQTAGSFVGIYLFAGTGHKVYNNLIYDIRSTTGNIEGIRVRTAGSAPEIYFNTIAFNDANPTSGSLLGFKEELSNTNSILRNNIFSITQTAAGNSGALQLAATSSVTTAINSNYNVFWTPGGNTAIKINSSPNPPTFFPTLADWQAASTQDAASFQTDPNFQSPTNPIPTSGVINNQAVTGTGITTDITGAPRGASPDPGAYEFAPPSADAAMTNYVLPPIPHCAATLDVKFILTNAGADPLNSVTINWTVNGVAQATVNWNGPPLASGNSTTVTLGTIPVSPATYYDFTATCSNPNGGPDSNPSNDSFTYLDFRKGYEGTLTINGAVPASNTNFQSFQSAADALAQYGVCTAVTINVSNGPYTEQVVFNAIPGTSASNRVTLNGNNQLLQFNPTVAVTDHILQLNGVEYMIVEKLVVQSLHQDQGRGIHITNNASKLVIRENTVTVSTTNSVSSAFPIIISGQNWLLDGSLSDSVVITGNTVIGGYSGIQLSGEHWTQPLTRIRVENNTILDWYGFGVYLSYTNNAIVRSNIIRRPNRSNSGSDAVTPAGITIPAGSLGFLLDKNRIFDLHLGMPGSPTISRGVYLSGTSIAPTSGTIQNNLIYGMNNDGAQYGIQNNSVNGPVNIYHNTIVLNNATGASTSNTNAINMSNLNTQAGTDMRNNIFVVTRGGTGVKRIIDVAAASSTFTSNYNVTWLNAPGGTQTYGQVGSTNYVTFNDWTTGTGHDLNSVFADPQFVNPPAGNYTPSYIPADGSIMGTSSVGVTDDILGVVRSANPDPGAYEWVPPACTSANGGTAVVSGTSVFCSSGSATITATGYSVGTGSSYQWQYSSDNFVSNVADLTGQTNPASATTGTITATTYYRLKVTCNTGPTTAYSNIVTIAVGQPVNISVQPVSQTKCTGASVTFSVTAANAASYQWQKNTVNIPGANAAAYTINNLALSDGGSYRVVIGGQGACPNVISDAAILTMQESVAIIVHPASRSVCSGTAVIFSVTATGTGLTYQWRKGGVNIPGATTATLTLNNVVSGDAGSYDVVVTGACGTLTSNTAVLTVTQTGSWIGVTSSDWNTASNWCGGIPGAGTDVLIPVGAPNMPILSSGTGNARQITINAGATLTIGNAGILNIYGDLINNGIFNATAGSLAFRGSSPQSIPAFIALNATMNGTGGVNLAGNASVTGVLTLTAGNITLGSNNISLSSGSGGSPGSHIVTNGSGNVIVLALAAGNSRTIPVGANASTYNPVTLSATAGHVTDNFTVSCRTGVFVNGISGATYMNNIVDRTWIINEATAGGSQVTLSFQWTGTQELTGFQRNRSYVIRHNGTAWLAGPESPASGTDPYSQTISGVNTFSPFAVRSEAIPRPRTGIYPNPANNRLNVVLDLSADTPVTFTVFDSKGRKMLQSETTLLAGLSRTTLNLDKLASGVYILQVSTATSPKLMVERFVKQR
ncbi:MAG: right-handed parallel beta-helix repeat-containing protein [Chitinophagaceae bacterium]